MIPELYLHGLSEGDFDLALRGLLGEDAPVSASTVARLKSKWNDELAQWRSRPLDDLEVVYMWVDGVYVKAGLEKEKAAVLVVMAALSDGSKVVVSAVPGYRESTWSEVLRDIKRRGLSCPRLVVGTDTWASGEAQRLSAGQSNAAGGKRARQATTGPGQAHAAYYPLRAERGERLRTVGGAATIPTSGLSLGAGPAWSPSMTSQRSTGGTFARRTR